MTFPITSIYATALALWLVALTVHVILHRARSHVSLGHGGDAHLHEAMRRHGNLAETAPMVLILMALAEAGGLGEGWLHAAGGLLLLGRLIHPFGLDAENGGSVLRIAGISLGWVALLIPVVFVLRRAAGL